MSSVSEKACVRSPKYMSSVSEKFHGKILCMSEMIHIKEISCQRSSLSYEFRVGEVSCQRISMSEKFRV